MAYGLQLWDSSGNLTLDTSDRLSRWVASYSATTWVPTSWAGSYYGYMMTVSGVDIYYFLYDMTIDIPVPGMANNGSWVVMGVPFTNVSSIVISGTTYPLVTQPIVSINAGYIRITWAAIHTVARQPPQSQVTYVRANMNISYNFSVFKY